MLTLRGAPALSAFRLDKLAPRLHDIHPDIQLLSNVPRRLFRCKTLAGSNYYRYLVVFSTWQGLWDAVRQLGETTGSKARRPEELYLILDPTQQYLMQSGRTLFHEMTFDDVHRMQLDIEVLGRMLTRELAKDGKGISERDLQKAVGG